MTSGASSFGQAMTFLEMFRGDGVGSVGADRADDQRMTFPALDKLSGSLEGLFPGLVFRGGKVDHGLAKDAAHADARALFGHHLFEHIHVDHGGGAAAQHFPNR